MFGCGMIKYCLKLSVTIVGCVIQDELFTPNKRKARKDEDSVHPLR
jgi:hypothetical protein